MTKAWVFGAFLLAASGQVALAQNAAPGAGAGGAGAQGDFLQRMMAMDSNKDGILEKSEYLKTAGEQFDRMDLDHDGKITPQEREKLREYVRQRGAGGGAQRR
jgi:hypothetical protein